MQVPAHGAAHCFLSSALSAQHPPSLRTDRRSLAAQALRPPRLPAGAQGLASESPGRLSARCSRPGGQLSGFKLLRPRRGFVAAHWQLAGQPECHAGAVTARVTRTPGRRVRVRCGSGQWPRLRLAAPPARRGGRTGRGSRRRVGRRRGDGSEPAALARRPGLLVAAATVTPNPAAAPCNPIAVRTQAAEQCVRVDRDRTAASPTGHST